MNQIWSKESMIRQEIGDEEYDMLPTCEHGMRVGQYCIQCKASIGYVRIVKTKRGKQ